MLGFLGCNDAGHVTYVLSRATAKIVRLHGVVIPSDYPSHEKVPTVRRSILDQQTAGQLPRSNMQSRNQSRRFCNLGVDRDGTRT